MTLYEQPPALCGPWGAEAMLSTETIHLMSSEGPLTCCRTPMKTWLSLATPILVNASQWTLYEFPSVAPANRKLTLLT